MIYRPGCRFREPFVVQSNPATRHADNMFALEMIPSLNRIPSKRYSLPWFARWVERFELIPVDFQCHNCTTVLPDWTSLVNHVCRRTS